MLRNYIRIALRHLTRHRLYATINLVGLSVGIACGTLILLFARNEWTADRFHARADDIYRVYRVEHRTDGSVKRSAGVSVPLGPALERDLPNVEAVVRLRGGGAQVTVADRTFDEEVLYADAAFFDVFDFPLEGSATGSLASRNGVVLGFDAARRFFGPEDPVGRTLTIATGEDPEVYSVTGVAAPVPGNSSIAFDVLLPMEAWPDYAERADVWRGFSVAAYVLLDEGTEPATAQAGLDALVRPYYQPMIDEAQAAAFWVEGDEAFDLELQPLREVHFADGFTNMVARTADPVGLYVLMGIGLLVLLLACVNFMVLAVGQASARAREIGVRKSVGARRGQLALQYGVEAFVNAVLALGIGLALTALALPLFNQLAETNLGPEVLDTTLVLQLLALTLFTGLAAGAYPALVLSGFGASRVLKGERPGGGGMSFARVMVVAQFVISIGMIAATLVLHDQMRYMRTKDLGFADEQIVAVDLHASQADEDVVFDRLRTALSSRPDVVEVSATSYAMGDGWSRSILRQGDQQIITYFSRIDPSFIRTMELEVVAGRGFEEGRASDRRDVVVNETLARELGFEDPVGKLLPGFEEEGVRILGVVRDFHFRSLRERIEPLVLHMDPALTAIRYAFVRVRTDDIAQTLAAMSGAWEGIGTGLTFDYEFLDARLDALYAAEERWARIVRTAAMLAVLIACLGLFGLATLSASRRTKEIGIRKVLGASVTGVVALLSREFLALVGVAFVVAVPLAWLVMEQWLSGFAYRITLAPGVFVLAGVAAATCAAVAVGWQTMRVARSEPARSLRYE